MSFAGCPILSKSLEGYCLLCALFIWPLGLTDFVCIKGHVFVCAGAFFLRLIRKLITIELCYCAGHAYFYWADLGYICMQASMHHMYRRACSH